MTAGEDDRLIAWADELRAVHTRLRQALRVTREALAAGDPAGEATRELLLYCHGFCAALTAHHVGEDRTLFPAIVTAHPHLAPVIRTLEQDHSMIGHLLGDLQAAVDRAGAPEELAGHIEGIAAIMESHFGYEERQLLTILETLALDADPAVVLGPL